MFTNWRKQKPKFSDIKSLFNAEQNDLSAQCQSVFVWREEWPYAATGRGDFFVSTVIVLLLLLVSKDKWDLKFVQLVGFYKQLHWISRKAFPGERTVLILWFLCHVILFKSSLQQKRSRPFNPGWRRNSVQVLVLVADVCCIGNIDGAFFLL